MLQLVRSVSHGKGVNVLVCSHLLPDIERTCDNVIVLLAGQLRASGQIRDLKSVKGQPMDVELREPSEAFESAIAGLGLQLLEHAKRNEYRVQGKGTMDEVSRQIFAAARTSGSQVRSLQLAQRSLEEAFLEVVGGE